MPEIIERDLLITSSIIDSYDWVKNAPPSWKQKAYDDFWGALTRTKEWKPDKKIQRGIDFENKVYEYARRELPENVSPEFRLMVNESKNAIIQKKIKKIETINGQSFCLYGKTDLWFPEIIKDIKTTASYKESKYQKSIQHRLYMYIEQIPRFEYLVAVFNDNEDDKKVQRVERIYVETYDMEALKQNVHERVWEFYSFLANDSDLFDAYVNKFCLF